MELMRKPTDEEIAKNPYTIARKLIELDSAIRFGKEMLNDGDTVYALPKDVKEKIEPNKKYFIYYKWHDSADSSDSTTFYHIFYIEEIG